MRISDCIKVLIIAITLGTALPTYAQQISLQLNDAPVVRFLDALQKQSGYVVILIQPVFRDHPRVTVSVDHQPLEKVLLEVLIPLGAEFVLVEKNIVIREKAKTAETAASRPKAAQHENRTINGRILDTLGNGIPNATIRIKFDNLSGAVSDKEGRFHLTVSGTHGEPILGRPAAPVHGPANSSRDLLVSSIGYQTLEYPISPSDSLVLIHLKEDLGALDAAQVTAYGETTNRLTTAGSQTISAARLAEYPVDNALDAVQDLTTGVFIQRQSGMPGSAYSSHIRGVNSLSGSVNTESQPLVVVDGVAYPGSVLPFLSLNMPGIQLGGNGLNYLLPGSIESMTILKDADALSIYGSRGAYGVILIKTKSGRGHSSGLSFREMAGIDEIGITPRLMNTDQYLTIRREAFTNDGITPGPLDMDLNGTWSQRSYIDWTKYFYKRRSGLSDTYLTWHNGNDIASWSVGGGFRYDGGLLVNGNGNKMGGVHYNLNAFQNKKLSVTVLGVYTHTDNNNTPFDPLGIYSSDRLIDFAPNAPSQLNPTGSLNWQDYPQYNPAHDIREVYRNQTNNSVTGTTITYKPADKFTLKLGFGYNAITGTELDGFPAAWSNPASIPSIQSAMNSYSVKTWTLEPNANYSTRLFGKSLLSVTAGGTAQQIKNYNKVLSATGLTSDAQLPYPGSAPQPDQTLNFNGYDKRYLGFFALINYNWQERYILNLGLRRDGSSIFGSAQQYGNFYSAGAAWLLSSEPWFKKLMPFANFAKLRGSYGTVGGDNINSGQASSTYGSSISYEGSPGLSAGRLANPYLHWEKNRKWNAALDLHVLNDRVAVELEYYHTRVYDQLKGTALSVVTGFTSIVKNSNDIVITGYGFECTVRTENLRGKKFKWTTEINFTLPRNILTSFPGLAAQGISNLQVGGSVQGVQVYDYQGVNPQDGQLLFKNAAGQVGEFLFGSSQTLIPQDRVKFINLSPDYFGSVINTFSLGPWRLDLVAGFVDRLGGSYLGNQIFAPGNENSNYTKEVLRRWQKPGDRTSVPRVSTSAVSLINWMLFTQSSGAYAHAGYFRLNNLYLAYRLPVNRLKHGYDLTLFLQGENLLTITRYHDYDPSNLGVGMPPDKRIAGGLKMEL